MHSKSVSIIFMPYDYANEVTDELVKSLLSRYHIGLETSMKGSDIVPDFILFFNFCIKNVTKLILNVVA